MGAAPDWMGPRSVVSPLRKVESHTVSVASPSGKPGPQRFARVPTHAIGVARERRNNPRASLSLPLRLTRVGDHLEPIPVTLVTRNISSSGVYFLAPRDFEPGTAIELEVALIERPARPRQRANVHRCAHRARRRSGYARLARLRCHLRRLRAAPRRHRSAALSQSLKPAERFKSFDRQSLGIRPPKTKSVFARSRNEIFHS